MVCHRTMNKLPRHVKHTFYCEECDRCYSIRYIDRHHRTYKHQHNLLMQEKHTTSSSNVLHSSSLLLKVIWRCSTSLLLNQKMVPLYGFSIIIWFHYMVSQSSYGFHYMVSQSSYGSIIWFLNHHMVPLYGFSIIIWFHYMVSQSKNGFPKYGFSIKKWFPKRWFSQKNGKLYVSKSDKCV